ncbi:MAG: M20/M25/M40 family metallo-hydrolase, partial [Actinobacteria bacterium]|nr:M20/M25/M40 family metallo-hydrolase [Actinomycetota bacterium]
MDDTRLLDTFLDLVRIDSPSKQEARIATYCKEVLEDAGCHVFIDDSAGLSGSDTGNVIATLPGTAPGKVFIAAHMDNVSPCCGVQPIIESGVVYSDGTTVLGADDKAGIAVAIEAIRTMAESEDPHPTVVALFTVQEEIGMHGSKNLPDDLFAGELTLVCDAEC